jgi:hypothetical protein
VRCVGWKVWYSKGRKYSSVDTHWVELPETGLLILQLYFDKRGRHSRLPYRQKYLGDDYYWFLKPDVFGCCKHEEMTKYDICRKYPGAVIKRGIWVGGEEIHRVEHEATMDRFFP